MQRNVSQQRHTSVQRTQVMLRCVVTRAHGLTELHTKCKMRGDYYSGRGTLVFSEVHVRRAVFIRRNAV